MDHNEERRKALEHIAPNLSQRYPFGSAYATSSNSSSGAVPDAPDQVRYRTPGLNLPPSGSGSLPVEGSYSESSGTENIASSQSYHREATSAFPASNMSQTMLGYGQNYGTDSRGHTAPGFPGYGGNGMTMYNIQGHAAAQGPVYGAQQFNQRHSTSVQMLPTDTASAYFHMAPGAGSLQSMNQNPEEDMYAHQGANISYQDNVRRTDDAQGATASASSVDQAPASQPGTLSAHDAVEEKLANYKQQLGTVFQDITRGQLARAAETLLYLSNWLLPQITELGRFLARWRDRYCARQAETNSRGPPDRLPLR